MKTSDQRGAALIIVLSCVVLLSTLIVAFLSSVQTEVQISKIYSDTNATRLLADTAVKTVMTQIREATIVPGVTWASQPGMIRTFDNSGRLQTAYKLYSSDQMTAGSVDAAAEFAAMSRWDKEPALFTDLNEMAGGIHPVLEPPTGMPGFTMGTVPGTLGVPAAMPARWLYVLEDGTLVPPTSTNGLDATVAGAQNSPIVGRIAFWTDDETCKVNINTAGEGTFWDTPRFEGSTERAYGKCQPAHAEYQRYPGHPATVSLSTVLNTFIPGITPDRIYEIAPRLVGGGSNGGTTVPTGTLVPDTDRLYSDETELLFKDDRTPQGLDRSFLQKSRFFLTSASRSPELTLFGTPRVSVWPVHTNTSAAYSNAYDRLSAFCSTLGDASNPLRYYFQRTSAGSTTADVSLPRNRQILDYLDRMAGQEIPGFGGNFHAASKYGIPETQQILTEIFDYVRATNSRDATVTNPYADPAPTSTQPWVSGRGQVTPSIRSDWGKPGGNGTQGFGRFYRVNEAGILFVGLGRGKLVNALPANSAAVPILPPQIPTSTPRDVADDAMAVQAYFLLSFFDVNQGWTRHEPNFTVEIENLDKFKLNGTTMGFPTKNSLQIEGAYSGYWGGNQGGGVMDFRAMIGFRKLSQTLPIPKTRFPFYSNIISVPLTVPTAANPQMNFQGDKITVRIYTGNSTAAGNLVQTLTIDFPSDSSMPIPQLPTNRLLGFDDLPVYKAYTPFGYERRTDDLGTRLSNNVCDRFDTMYNQLCISTFGTATEGNRTIEPADVCRSVIVASGDYRQLAANDVPTTVFSAHQPSDSTKKFAHGFAAGIGSPFRGASRGKMVKDANYPVTTIISKGAPSPALPAGINGVYRSTLSGLKPGDWDAGLPTAPDGPYINKADDGNIAEIATKTPYFDSILFQATSDTFSSPNRQIPSPLILGSLPTGVLSGRPWQTLLFRPDLTSEHPGAITPKDHLLADWFWMPTVEPYAESEPLASSGKINLNYQIFPYTYITRSTALHAAMKAEKIAAVPVSAADKYKTDPNFGSVRYSINMDEDTGTLRQFKTRFLAGDIFRSPTEICDIWLVPSGQSWSTDAAAEAFWNNNTLTADNVRERPYVNLHAKLTTKSNTYRVHYRVQALKKRKGSSTDVWEEKKDRVAGEQRGSFLVERYINPTRTDLPDSAGNGTLTSLEPNYQFRILNSSVVTR